MMKTDDSRTRHFDYARLAGLAYLGVAIGGFFGEFQGREALVVAGDAAATVDRILAHELTFRLALLADVGLLVCEVVLALAFYRLFERVDRDLALVALFLNLIRIPVMTANLVNHFGVLVTLHGGHLGGFDDAQVSGLVLWLLDLHRHAYVAAGVFFGAWCFVVGWLMRASGFFPRPMPYLMMSALISYWTELVVVFLAPAYGDAILPTMHVVSGLAECSLCLYLVVRSGPVHRAYVAFVTRPGELGAEEVPMPARAGAI